MSLVPNIWAFLRKLYLYALVILNKGLIINLVMISLIRFLRYSSVCVCALSHVRLFVTTWTIVHPPGSSVHVIFQARILEWVAISYSRGSSLPRDRTWVSCISRQVLFNTAPQVYIGFNVFKDSRRFRRDINDSHLRTAALELLTFEELNK